LGAILVGWITSLFTLFVIIVGAIGIALSLNVDLTAPLSGSNQSISLSLSFAIFIAVFITFFTGGYVAGRMAALAGAINGVMVVITSSLALFFGGTFAVIIGNSLGIGVVDLIKETAGSLATMLVFVTFFAIVGGILGGRLGEGYFMRLDVALARQEQARRAKQGETTRGTTSPQSKNEVLDKGLEHAS
jgi:heme A synthase